MFEAISPPSGVSAAGMSFVVVGLPLVPVTRTPWRPAASRDNRSGARRRPIMPPMTEPSPLPARRETVAAAPPLVVAVCARLGSLKRCGVLSSIVARCYLLATLRRAASPGRTMTAPLTLSTPRHDHLPPRTPGAHDHVRFTPDVAPRANTTAAV